MRSLALAAVCAILAGCAPHTPKDGRQLVRQCLWGGDLYLINGRLWKVSDNLFDPTTLVAPGVPLETVCSSYRENP